MTQEIYWELLAWLFRSFLAVTAFAFVVAGYQTLRGRPRRGRSRNKSEGRGPVYRPSRNAVPLFKGNVFDLMGH